MNRATDEIGINNICEVQSAVMFDANVGADTDADVGAGTEVDADTDADVDAGADTDVDADTDANAGVDVDTGAGAERIFHQRGRWVRRTCA
jgi:hypothetical protein